MEYKKIHLGVTPSYDLCGKLVSNIHFNNFDRIIYITLEKSMKVTNIQISYEKAIAIGLIDLDVLDFYFNKF